MVNEKFAFGGGQSPKDWNFMVNDLICDQSYRNFTILLTLIANEEN